MSDMPNNRYLELFKNTGLLAIGNFSSKILVFLMVPLYTNVLTTTEYGIYDIFITTIQLLIPVLSLNVTDGILRFSLENRKNINQVCRVSTKFLLLSVVPAGLVLIVNQIGVFSPDLKKYSAYVFAYYISYMFNQFLIQFAKGIDKVSIMTISGVIGTFVTVSVCAIELIVFKHGLKGFFFANVLGQFIPAFYLFIALGFWRYLKKPKGADVDSTLQRRLLAYSVPLIMTTIGWWLNNTSDKYVITIMKGVELNGLLSIAYKIPSILTILYGIFIQAWQISAMKEYGKENSVSFYNKVFTFLNIFVYFAASILTLSTRPLAHIAFAKEFYSAWKFVPYLLMSAVFTAMAGYVAPILTSAYRTWAVAKSTIIGGLANVVLNIVFIYVVGNIGVAAATMVSSFLIFYFRYKASEGFILKSSFFRGCYLWGLLFIQSTLEIFKLEILQIPCIMIAFALNYHEIKEIFSKLSKFFWRKNNG